MASPCRGGVALMQLKITADTSMSFEVEVNGVTRLLQMVSGDWKLVDPGKAYEYTFVAQGRVPWQRALAKAIEKMSPIQ